MKSVWWISLDASGNQHEHLSEQKLSLSMTVSFKVQQIGRRNWDSKPLL
jgi:hypothetical protein